jgi:hypothetical protein
LERIIAYVENNSVKAGLAARAADFVGSSAYERLRLGIEAGLPLARPRPTVN